MKKKGIWVRGMRKYTMCRERKGHLGLGDGLEGKMRT